MSRFANFAPDFEYVNAGAIPGLGGVYRGAEGYRRFVEAFWSEFDDPWIEVHELIDAGDEVFVSLTLRGRGKQSGVETSWSFLARMERAGREGRTGAWVPKKRRGPRSRRASGVGDVAGERRARSLGVRGVRCTRDGVEKAARSGLVAPDIEIDFSALHPDGPIVRGLERWREHADSLPWGGSLKLEPERYFDVDDERVLVFVRVTAEGEESGVPVEMRDAHEFTIRDGVFVRWKVYADRTEALEAGGLEE